MRVAPAERRPAALRRAPRRSARHHPCGAKENGENADASDKWFDEECHGTPLDLTVPRRPLGHRTEHTRNLADTVCPVSSALCRRRHPALHSTGRRSPFDFYCNA